MESARQRYNLGHFHFTGHRCVEKFMTIKDARFKPQPSIPMQSFVTMSFTLSQSVSSDLIGITYLLWKLMTKGEKLEQRYVSNGRDQIWTWTREQH